MIQYELATIETRNNNWALNTICDEKTKLKLIYYTDPGYLYHTIWNAHIITRTPWRTVPR